MLDVTFEVSVVDDTIKSIQAPYDAEVNQGHTCLKGRYAFSFYNHPDRIKTPLIRKNGTLQPASWEEAYDFIANKLNEIKRPMALMLLVESPLQGVLTRRIISCRNL